VSRTNPESGEGRITAQPLQAARQTVRWGAGLSRLELARTLCEHWGWGTASGSYRVTAGLQVLEEWEQQGLLRLPPKRPMTRWSTDQASGAVLTPRTQPRAPLVGGLSEVGRVGLERVHDRDGKQLWNEYVDGYHALGYRQPPGCFLRYFIAGEAGWLGCVLMAGAAKAIRGRDQWIQWSRPRRAQNLAWVINNSRLLIFPWVRLDHLGSHVLGQLARGVRADWLERWGYGPLLMESFVDPEKFSGKCYQAAGWIPLGTTTGRGPRRAAHRYESSPKLVYVKALADDFRERLRGGPLPRRVEP
jgi:Druantia protein DruA